MNIKTKIKIFECENIGISYGQFFTGINKNIDFDYHIFIEDDYIVFDDYFEKKFNLGKPKIKKKLYYIVK